MTAPARTVTAVLTCHDRREHTLACLDAIAGQGGHDAAVDVVVVDDGSTDGTAEAVSRRHPSATIVPGDGSLWWNGGMRLGLATALRGDDPDHLWWLNDDTVLDPDALATLLAVVDAVGPADTPPIVVGSTRDPDSGELTYGGVVPTAPATADALRARRAGRCSAAARP